MKRVKFRFVVFTFLLVFMNTLILAQRMPKEFSEKRKDAVDLLIDQPKNLYFLHEKMGKKNRYYINPMEKEWVFLITNQFDSLLTTIQRNESFLSLINIKRAAYHEDVPEEYKSVIPVVEDRFNKQLSRQIYNERSYIQNAINTSDLSDEDKDFLNYFLIFTIHQIKICDDDHQKETFKLGQEFIEKYEDSKYKRFIEKYSSTFKTWSNSGWEYVLKGNTYRFTGGLGEHLSPTLLAGFQLSYTKKKWYFSGTISFGRNRAEKGFFHHILLEENRRFNTMSAGFSVGNHVLLLEKWTVTPYIGLNLDVLSPQPFAFESAGSLNLRSIPGVGPKFGASLDFSVPKEECNKSGVSQMEERKKSRIFRLDLSYHIPGFHRTVDDLSGGYFNIGLGFGIFQPKVKEDIQL